MSCHPRTAIVALSALALALATPSIALAQIAGESVNMVTGTEWPGGDPYLQRQNEPSIAVSSANPEHLLAGANDYRTVDIAKAPADKMAGDAWAGIFKSLDGGKTWKSYLMPGYPQDPARYDRNGALLSRTSLQAPPLMWCGAATAAVKDATTGAVVTPATDGTCTSAADPVVRAGADGMLYFGGITFQRFTNNGKVYLARFIDLNNKENGDATLGTDPIRFVDQKIVTVGGPSDFVDKPWMAVDVPRPWNPTCTVSVTNPDGTVAKRSFPGHTVYLAWLRLYNGETQSDVMVRHSDDCGASWSAPVKVSDASSTANEGPSIAIDPPTGHVYVVWRRVASGTQTNAILLSRSFSRGNRFTRPREVAQVNPFDQATTPSGFRVTLFPSAAVSVDGAGVRRLHVAWAERNDPATQNARVVVATKLLSPPPASLSENDETDATCQRLDRARSVDGTPIAVDASPLPGRGTKEYFTSGHQFMPSLTFSQGRLVLVYYDTRLDHTRAYYEPHLAPCSTDPSGQCWAPNADGSFYDVVRGPLGAPPVDGRNVPVGPDTLLDPWSDVFNAFVDDGNLHQVRHTVDVRMAVAPPADAPSFTPTALSRFPFGTRGDEGYLLDGSGNLSLPGFDGPIGVVSGKQLKLLQQLKVNPPNLPMFKAGTKPFLGDYIDVQGPAFVRKNGKWAFNTDWAASPVFHAVWTSNEDVRAPPDGRWDLYAPINVQGKSRIDPTQTVTACTEATAAYVASRNQNVYTARITDGLVVTTPQNAKPLSATQVRSFVVAATNVTDRKKRVTFSFSAPSGTSASFQALPNDQLATLPTVTVDVAPHSTVSRSLFVKSSNASATLTATVAEAGAGGASGSVTLNPPGTTPGLVAPDNGGSIAGGETFTIVQVSANLSNANLSNANLSNANLSNANLSNANLSNANLSNANLSNANLSNAALANLSNANLCNANLSNANLSNANLSNANLSNANLSNANLSNSAISDVNYEFQNTGNTTASYAVRLVGQKPAPGEVVQLIVAKTYTTPTAVGCTLKEEAHSHVLASIDDVSAAIVDPASQVNPGVADASVQNVTLVLAPGEKAQITLRGNVPLARMAAIGSAVTPAPVAQKTPVGGTSGTTTYAQATPRAATTTSIAYDTTGLLTALVTWSAGPDAMAHPVTTGTVSFVTSDGKFLGTVGLDATGTALFHPADLVTGASVTAFYSGTNAYLPSQATVATQAVAVTVSPAAPTVAPQGYAVLTASVTGTANPDVIWSIVDAGGGSINTDGPSWIGYYAAPAAPGVYRVKATSVADPTKSGLSTVTVAAPPAEGVIVYGPSASLVTGQFGTFTASVGGVIGSAVSWSVTGPAGASISASAAYAATFIAGTAGTYTVTATYAGASGSTSGSASVTVGDAGPAAMTTVADPPPFYYFLPPDGAQRIAQAVAGFQGTFRAVRLPIVCAAGVDLTVDVQEVTNGVPNGIVRARKVFSEAQQLLPDFHATLDLFQPLYFDAPVAAWPQFAVVVTAHGTNSNAGCAFVPAPAGNPYTGGDASVDNNGSGYWGPLGNGYLDVPFEVVVAPPGLQVVGGDMSGSWQNVNVYRNGAPVADAVVTVSDPTSTANFVTLGLMSGGYYYGFLPSIVPPGGAVMVTVTQGGETVVGTGRVPYPPSNVLPNSGSAPSSVSAPIHLTWDDFQENPHAFRISAQWHQTVGDLTYGMGTSFSLPGGISPRAFDIPAGTFPYAGASAWEARVYVYNYGSFTGPCAGCVMPLRSAPSPEQNPINVAP